MINAFVWLIVVVGAISVPAFAQVELQVGILVDGSASIPAEDFRTVKATLARAIVTPNLLPLDGSVELTIVEFSDVSATIVVPPTVVSAASLVTIEQSILDIQQGGGGTPLWVALDLIVDQMIHSPNFSSAVRQAINVITDGQPKIPIQGIFEQEGADLSLAARDRAVRAGIDEIDAEAIGIGFTPGPFQDFLMTFVWPQPGVLIDNFQEFELLFEPGFVALIREFAEVEVVVRSKLIELVDLAVLSEVLENKPGQPIPLVSPWGMLTLAGVFLFILYRACRRRQRSGD